MKLTNEAKLAIKAQQELQNIKLKMDKWYFNNIKIGDIEFVNKKELLNELLLKMKKIKEEMQKTSYRDSVNCSWIFDEILEELKSL